MIYRELSDNRFMQNFPCAFLDYLVLDVAGETEFHAFVASGDGKYFHMHSSFGLGREDLKVLLAPRKAAPPFEKATCHFALELPEISFSCLSLPLNTEETIDYFEKSLAQKGKTIPLPSGSGMLLAFETKDNSYLVNLASHSRANNTEATIMELSL